MRKISEILREIDASDIRDGFNEYARRTAEKNYPDVYTADRPNTDPKKSDDKLLDHVINGFKKLDKS